MAGKTPKGSAIWEWQSYGLRISPTAGLQRQDTEHWPWPSTGPREIDVNRLLLWKRKGMTRESKRPFPGHIARNLNCQNMNSGLALCLSRHHLQGLYPNGTEPQSPSSPASLPTSTHTGVKPQGLPEADQKQPELPGQHFSPRALVSAASTGCWCHGHVQPRPELAVSSERPSPRLIPHRAWHRTSRNGVGRTGREP